MCEVQKRGQGVCFFLSLRVQLPRIIFVTDLLVVTVSLLAARPAATTAATSAPEQPGGQGEGGEGEGGRER